MTKQPNAVLSPHIVLRITSPWCNDCVRDVDQCRSCENKPSTAIQIQCLNTGKKRVTNKSNLYPLLGSDYISPKLLQYVTQLHSRLKQDSITHTLNEEGEINNHQTQPYIEPNTSLTNMKSTDPPNIEEQTK